jgi:ComF family protein
LVSWGAELLDLLLPAGCVACRAWIPGGAQAPLVCGRCAARLRSAPWPRCDRCHHPLGTGRAASDGCRECANWPPELTRARYACAMGSPAADLVHALKYEGWPELARFMGDRMARVAPAGEGRAGGPASPADRGRQVLVVAVPTTPDRVESRGYNQAELLARRVAEVLGLPVAEALFRPGASRSQTALGAEARRENVRDAVRPVPGAEGVLQGAHVFLVDDVLTTGATVSEAAKVLVRMGAEAVTALAFARALATPPRNSRQALS